MAKLAEFVIPAALRRQLKAGTMQKLLAQIMKLNWIPSRLSALLMIAVCPIVGLDARGAARIWRRDRRRHASPNSAQTESACAGALGLRLAGPAVYFGKLVEKPTIGDASREIEWGDIARATRLMLAASVCALVVFGAARAAVVLAVGAMS